MNRVPITPRVFRLIDEAIDRLSLKLDGLHVLTEAASGAFVVTPLIAARAGATVTAIAADSSHGRATEVMEYVRGWSESLGVSDMIDVTTEGPAKRAPRADIVTNLGFVRPINRELLSQLKSHAVVCLMCEPWELRPQDVDAEACRQLEVPLLATNECDERLRIFDYVGMLATKLLFEAGVEIFRSRVVVIGSEPFGGAVVAALSRMGASVRHVAAIPEQTTVDDFVGPDVDRADALVLVEHCDRRRLVGGGGGIRPERFRASGCRLVHIAGSVDAAALARAGIRKHPEREVEAGYMTLATDYVGVRPVIDLHSGGLAVGAIGARCRLAGGSVDGAIRAVEESGLGLRVPVTSSMNIPTS